MTLIGVLRITSPDALPFAREKLRSCLVAAGLRPVVAGQVTACVSQALRGTVPVELSVSLDDTGRRLRLQPDAISGRYASLALPVPPDHVKVEAMKAILARLTREELLHDLEHQVQQRTAELARERERSERLLKSMLPEIIAERMKNGETIADSHEATVLFADIVGFTELAKDRSAEAIVAILDRLFRQFDDIAERHHLEKIKTIGDCYMAAAGIPTAQPDHVDRAVLAGLDIIAAIRAARDDLGTAIDVRVGVHTGPLVAGVIGTRRYTYDVWGDTVNVASRMESQGVPGQLQVSDDVRQRLGERFKLEDRGAIALKNRGMMQTWLVHDIAALEGS